MALDYQFTDPFQLPASAQKVIPQELGGDFLASLNRSMDLQEQKSRENLLGFQESRGLLRSGDTNRRLVEDVLGPGDTQRRNALLGIAVPAAMQGQQQGFQEQYATNRNRQGLESALVEMEKRYHYEAQLAQLQEALMRDRPGQNGPSASQMFMKSLFPILGNVAGGLAFSGGAGLMKSLIGGSLSGTPKDQYGPVTGSYQNTSGGYTNY